MSGPVVVVAMRDRLLADLVVQALGSAGDPVHLVPSEADLVEAVGAAGAEVLLADRVADPEGSLVIPAIRRLGCRVLAVVAEASVDGAMVVLLAGASGLVVLADTSPADLAAAVRTVASGGQHLHPRAAEAILGAWRRGPSPSDAQRGPTDPVELTAREAEVLAALVDGLTTRGIARRLGAAEKTVENHKTRLYAKLGARNQAQAVALAHELGLVGGA